MPKQVTIEVDVPEGKVLGQYKLLEPKVLTSSIFAGWTQYNFLVYFEDDWQWPDWLKAEWIAMDEMGQWHGYREEPREALATWSYNGPRLLLAPWFDFTPPPCTDWRQSKRRRPTS